MSDPADSQVTVIPAPAEPAREYVAGSSHWLAYRGAVRALPHAVDDLERELGDDLYTRMLRDARVGGDIGILKAAILDDGVTLAPAKVDEGDEAGAALAAEALAFVERCLYEHLDIPLGDVLDDLLDALAYGSRVAEQVYRLVETDGPDRGRLVLRLKPKPRKATAFVVDAYLNVIGLLAAEPGRALSAGLIAIGGDPPANLLPRAKFAVLTYKPKDSDPRGSTVLRAAYNWWWIKQQILPELLKYGAQFGTPSIFGTTAENAASSDPAKTAEETFLDQLLAFQGGTAMAAPFGSDLKVIASQLSGDSFFERAIDLCDKQISTAIYGATRATQEAENGSRADSETAKGLFDSIVSAARLGIATMLQRDVISPLLAYNDAGWAAYPPVVSVGGVEAEDRTPAWAAAAQLERAGYLDPSQYQELDAALGLPVRTPDEVEQRRSRKAAPPVQPPPAFGQPPAQPQPDDAGDDQEEDDDARP